MINLRPGQREVAAYRGGQLAVPAVPGAGKTTVLAHLAADLIQEGLHKPGKILIVTVMNSAVSNFARRIGDFLEERGLPRTAGYEVKTLHSLAMSILKEKPEFLMINQNFEVIDESSQRSLVQHFAREWMAENQDLWKSQIKIDEDNQRWYPIAYEGWKKRTPEMFFDAIKYIKAACLTADELESYLQRLSDSSYLKWCLELYRDYSRELHRNGWLDFEDLIVQALRLLKEDAGVRERLQERWTFVFEDEAQDSNPLQEEILKILSSKSGNLVRVGDSNQAILGTFTAAEPEIFRSFCRREDVRVESINCSSRSSRQIIDLANRLVDWVRDCHPQEECRTALEAQHILPVPEDDPFPNPVTENYTIAVKRYDSYGDEIKQVARLACRHVKNNPELTAAILAPTNNDLVYLKGELERLQAPIEEVEKLTDRQIGTIESVELALRYLAQPHRVKLLIELLEHRMRMEFDQVGRNLLVSLFRRYTPEQLLYPIGERLPWREIPDELAEPQTYTAFMECLSAVRRWLDASVKIPPDELVLYLAEDMGLEADELDLAHNLALLIRQKMRELPGCLLYDIAREIQSLKGPLQHFLKTVNDRKGFEPKKGVVTLSTVHKAKGLEWDTVYLIGVTAYEYPSRVSDKFKGNYWFLEDDISDPISLIKAELKALRGEAVRDPIYTSKVEQISERLRLLYVGITRARRNLLISCHAKDRFGRDGKPSDVLVALEKIIEEERASYESSEE